MLDHPEPPQPIADAAGHSSTMEGSDRACKVKTLQLTSNFKVTLRTGRARDGRDPNFSVVSRRIRFSVVPSLFEMVSPEHSICVF